MRICIVWCCYRSSRDINIASIEDFDGGETIIPLPGGFQFLLQDQNDGVYPADNLNDPLFELIIETSPGAEFEILIGGSTYFSAGPCNISPPLCQGIGVSYLYPVGAGAPDNNNNNIPDMPGVPASLSCTNNTTGPNLELYIDTDHATYDELTYTTSIPVKLKDDLGGNSLISFTNMDLAISYEDIEGNLGISTTDINNLAVLNGNGVFSTANNIIECDISNNNSSFNIVLLSGEATLFNMEIVQPSTPLEGGSVDFEVEYVRLEYDNNGGCCTPTTGAPTTYVLSNAPLKCPANSDPAILPCLRRNG